MKTYLKPYIALLELHIGGNIMQTSRNTSNDSAPTEDNNELDRNHGITDGNDFDASIWHGNIWDE